MMFKYVIAAGKTCYLSFVNAGLQLQHYQRYEYGDRKLSNSSMILGLRICSILELDPYEFVFDESKDWIKKVR